jgi:hypothetical protein
MMEKGSKGINGLPHLFACGIKKESRGKTLLFIFPIGGVQWLGHVKSAGRDPR